MPGPFGDATSRLERRFLTTALVPTVVFLVATVSISLLAFNRLHLALRAWSSLTLSVQVLVSLAAASVVWFIAALVASNWRKIVRLYEGYPYARLYRARARKRHYSLYTYVQRVPGAAYHFHRQQAASSRDAYRRYAPVEFEEEVLPTALGNILLSAERYGFARYGMDVTLLWPRLYWQLPPEMRTDLEAFKEEHQLPLALSFMAAFSTVVSSLAMLVAQAPWTWFVVVSLLGTGMALGAYFLALERAEEYGEQIRAAVDLHRGALKDVWSEPHFGERSFFDRVQTFVETGYRTDIDQGPVLEGLPDEPSEGDPTPKPPPWPVGVVLSRLRLSSLVVGVVMLLVLSGALWLKSREVVMVVTRSRTDQFQRVTNVEVVHTPVRDVPDDALTSSRAAHGRIALSNLLPGVPLTKRNSLMENQTRTRRVVVDLPVIPLGRAPADVTPGRHVDIQLQPCGRLLHARVLVMREPPKIGQSATVTVELRAGAVQTLSGCPTAQATLIRP